MDVIGKGRENARMTHFLYRTHPVNGGLVFAEKERALRIHKIHTAIQEATTWEEFRELMPWDDYKSFQRYFDQMGEPGFPLSGTFNSEMVPGFMDGIYPPWLQLEMTRILPKTVLEEFGKGTYTTNDFYYHMNEEDLPEIKTRLEKLGHTVEDGSKYLFY